MNVTPFPISESTPDAFVGVERWALDPGRLQVLRIAVPALLAIVIAYAFAPVLPTMLAVSVAVAAGSAWSAARRIGRGSWTSAALDAFLAVSAFTYPVFFGGRVLSVVMAVVTLALLAARWFGLAMSPIAIAHALVTALGAGLAVAAVQFLLPMAWWWTTIGVALVSAIAIACALRMATVDAAVRTAVIALMLAEAILVVRALPTHWVVNGVMLAFAFAAATNRMRMVHWTYLGLLLVTLLAGGAMGR